MPIPVPSLATLEALGEDRPDEESKWSRMYQWQCPSCTETVVGRSQPIPAVVDQATDKERAVRFEHASFLETFQRYIAKHLKEHDNA